jgi:prophage tail gpP-like protein
MTITIGGVLFEKYSQAAVTLIYDSVGSTFSFQVYFNPDDAKQRRAMLPGTYPPVVIEHNGTLMLTGTLLYYRFKSSSVKHLVTVSGYTKTGVLEDCQIPSSVSLQSDNISLIDITRKILNVFGLQFVVDPDVEQVCSQPIKTTSADINETVKSYLSTIAAQINVVISHTTSGELYLTGYKTKTLIPATNIVNNTVTPADSTLAGIKSKANNQITVNKQSVFDFTPGMPGVEFEQVFDGQKMHSNIIVKGQASVPNDSNKSANASDSVPLLNPYVKQATSLAHLDNGNLATAVLFDTIQTIPRPKVVIQTSGSDITADKAARNILSDELKSLPLKIEIRGWNLGGHIVLPGDIVTVTNSELHIYNKARFFVESVEYRGNQVKETCTLNCVVPETFNNDTPENIFV